MNDYKTDSYNTNSLDKIFYFIERYPFATVCSEDGYDIHVYTPLAILDRDPGAVRLIGHLDSNNPLLQHFDNRQVSALFIGPNGYISPKDYVTDQYPTWNYALAKASGRCRLIKGYDRTYNMMRSFMTYLEPCPEKPVDINSSKFRNLMNMITFFEIQDVSLTGRFKFSQDKCKDDHVALEQSLQDRMVQTLAQALPILADLSDTPGEDI